MRLVLPSQVILRTVAQIYRSWPADGPWPARVEVDASSVERIDAAGLQLLISLRKTVASAGGEAVVRAGTEPCLHRCREAPLLRHLARPRRDRIMSREDGILEQLKTVFLEELEDGLSLMEEGLLGLEAHGFQKEVLNSVFRAAHSIKGGAGTFGQQPIVDLTHLAETILDDLRNRDAAPSKEVSRVLLETVDELGTMASALRGGGTCQPASAVVTARLRGLITSPYEGVPKRSSGKPSDNVTEAPARSLKIHFSPHETMMRSGNDPLAILRELARLGTLRGTCDASRVPVLGELDPTQIHATWALDLSTSKPDAEVHEPFAWVEGDCDLSIEPSPAETPDEARATDELRALTRGADAASVRVATEKIDHLVNLVGELVITQSILTQLMRDPTSLDLEETKAAVAQLERNSRDLQDAVMRVRMLPVAFGFSRLPRLVRDLATKLQKKVRLETAGESTELDKTVLEKMADPLVHLVRNAVDHGVEAPEARRAAGKDEVGVVSVSAMHQAGFVVIRVADDGGGIPLDRIAAKARAMGIIDQDATPARETLLELVFHPGLSTAGEVTDISGRGVGMDVVRRNIQELGGHIGVESTPQRGTVFTIRLPLTLAILDGQLFRVGDATYVIPLSSVVETLVPDPKHLRMVGPKAELYKLRSTYIPVVRLGRRLGHEERSGGLPRLLLVVDSDAGQVAFAIDELAAQQQVVIKSLEKNFRRVPGIAGATILGNGRVALILDVSALARPVRADESITEAA
ncbi:MAG: STAS domain-containing protein [Myxococcales bacterium]|nr:STAS domain-containing protein [Myxococcales bacterium]